MRGTRSPPRMRFGHAEAWELPVDLTYAERRDSPHGNAVAHRADVPRR
jgi:hypothetical protein